MTDCPNCEYHRKRAQLWRDEAYKQAGHPLPEQEPVSNPLDCGVYLGIGKDHAIKHRVDAPSPQRTWVGLTNEEQQQLYDQWQGDGWGSFYNGIEQALKEKNNG
jgi:hypothetical protein